MILPNSMHKGLDDFANMLKWFYYVPGILSSQETLATSAVLAKLGGNTHF